MVKKLMYIIVSGIIVANASVFAAGMPLLGFGDDGDNTKLSPRGMPLLTLPAINASAQTAAGVVDNSDENSPRSMDSSYSGRGLPLLSLPDDEGMPVLTMGAADRASPRSQASDRGIPVLGMPMLSIVDEGENSPRSTKSSHSDRGMPTLGLPTINTSTSQSKAPAESAKDI